MKRIVATLLCISLVFTQYKQAEAAVPVVVSGVAAGAVLLLAAGAVNYYSNPSGASAVATAAGNIYSNVTAYTQAVSALGQGYMMAQGAALGVAAADLLTAAKNASSSLYPHLVAALVPPPVPPPVNLQPGDIVNPGGNTSYQIKALIQEVPCASYQIIGGKCTANPQPNTCSTYNGGTCWVFDPSSLTAAQKVYSATPIYKGIPTTELNPPAQPVDVTPTQVPSLLSGTSDGGSISAGVASDINAMIAARAVAATPVSVSTTTTGDAVTAGDRNKTLPPYVPPATLPGTSTPVIPTTTLPGTSTGLGTGTTIAAEQNVTTATQTVTDIQTQLAADPTNTALQQQLVAAQQALAASQAALDQAKAAENEVYVNPLFPNRKTLNLESWRQLVNVLPSKFPFNLVSTLGSYFEPFLAAPVAPAFELHIYQDKKLNIDLSVFDTPVAIFRWGLALLLTFGMVQLLIRWWKGTV